MIPLALIAVYVTTGQLLPHASVSRQGYGRPGVAPDPPGLAYPVSWVGNEVLTRRPSDERQEGEEGRQDDPNEALACEKLFSQRRVQELPQQRPVKIPFHANHQHSQ